MDYDYHEKDTVKLDCKTERAICEIKDTLNHIAKRLDSLNRKVDELAARERMEARNR